MPPAPITLERAGDTFEIAERLPVLPLRDVVVFPHMMIPLLVGRSASLGAVTAAAAGERWVLLVAQRSADVQEPAAADLHRVGVAGRLLQVAQLPTGTCKVLVEGVARVRVTRYAPGEHHLRAAVAPLPFAPPPAGADFDAHARRVLALFEEYVGLHRRLPQELATIVQSTDSPAKQAFAVAAHLLVRHEVRQELLELPSLGAIFNRLGELLTAEIEILRLERKIEQDVRGTLFQNQREFYLQEQLKAIHRELGQEDGDDLAELEATITAKGMPEPVRERALRELRKLRRTSALSPESGVVRTYLDWLLALPWTERTDELLDVRLAQAVLDEDHHGLDEVKDRILDYLAVLSLVGRLQGPILCLVGPPGVGKTSLGRSVARALGRRFVRMALGGVRDEAEIRGHRRTYVGAMPGRVIQAMRRAEVVNPVVLLDEVDKMGQDWRGDPAAALLEVLDPEQHHAFNDHYLEVDYDLSQALFITTANSLAGIPEALRDRMEIIRLAGYVEQEKHAIARHFLIPRQLRAHGLDPALVTIAPEVVPAIVRGYTREAGVRELERRLARVARKLARRAAEAVPVGPAPATAGSAPPAARAITVTLDDLVPLLGVAPHDADEQALHDRVGVAAGLAYTAAGGELLEIEVATVRGRGRLQLTGTLGAVLKESASAALTYARTRAARLGIPRDFYRVRDIHLHIPSGATPKDGPSAGIAIAVAVVSALSGVPVRGDTAMTGEVTLRGRVLPIGGLKEKAVAALRSGVTHVIIPQANARELSEIPEEIRGQLHIHPVRSMDEVLTLALRPRPSAAAMAAATAAPHDTAAETAH